MKLYANRDGKLKNMSFSEAQRQHKNLLKIFSPTAEWIYSDIENNKELLPVIAIDAENDNLYSNNTRLFETLNIFSVLLKKIENGEIYNLTNQANVCNLCRGLGEIKSLNFDYIFTNTSKGYFNGLMASDIKAILKPYNFEKIKFLLETIENRHGICLTKPYDAMNKRERFVLKYGLLHSKFTFNFMGKTTHIVWQGLNHLLIKYLKNTKNLKLKNMLQTHIYTCVCPKCNGMLINTSKVNEQMEYLMKKIFWILNT